MTESPSTFMLTERTLGMFTPLEIPADAFKKAYELPIGDHVEKNYKGLSYLSWPFAFRYLKQEFPSLYVSFEEERIGWPVFGQEGCWLLRPYLTDGTKRTPALVFPLMDNRHNALKQLDARAVSDNIQRASVKCIATFTGLGLKLYAGEDIPKDDGEASKPAPAAKKAAPSPKEASGGIEGIGLELEKSFNGKESLLAFVRLIPCNSLMNVAVSSQEKQHLKILVSQKAMTLKTVQCLPMSFQQSLRLGRKTTTLPSLKKRMPLSSRSSVLLVTMHQMQLKQ